MLHRMETVSYSEAGQKSTRKPRVSRWEKVQYNYKENYKAFCFF